MKQELDVHSIEYNLVEILDVAESNDDYVAPRSYLSELTQNRLVELEELGYVTFYYNGVYVGVTKKGKELLGK